MYKNLNVGVVIPAYNEEAFISDVIGTMPGLIDKVVFVDDGSTDHTLERAQKVAKKNPGKYVLISNEINEGSGSAKITGYKRALELGMDQIVTMDGDGQMNPNEITRLLDPLVENKADYSKGNRLMSAETRYSMPKIRLFGNAILSFMNKFASGYWHIMDSQNGYTAIKRECLEILPLERMKKDYLFENDILTHLNVYNFRVVDVNMKAVYGGERSGIKTIPFMFRAMWTLVFRFFWRLKEKYLLHDFHPVIFFYLGGLILTPLGIVMGLRERIVYGSNTVAGGVLAAVLIITGVQFILFGMLFDRDTQK
jgi:glycosyltransferase involved in cell wall biosynthesis